LNANYCFNKIIQQNMLSRYSTRLASRCMQNRLSFKQQYRAIHSINDKLKEQGRFPPMYNSLLNFLPSGHMYVIETFGKFSSVRKSGLNLLIPFIQKIAYVIDERELCFRIDPEVATTRDNVMVKLGGNLYLRFYDAEKAAYGSSTPIYSACQFAQSAMRTCVGDLALDKLFSERNEINIRVTQALKNGTDKWGCEIIRFEITDLSPIDNSVIHALAKQSTAERERREKIIAAEALQREIQIKADAYAYQQKIEAEGESQKTKILADADYYKTTRAAEAEKNSLLLLASSLTDENGPNALQARLSTRYIDAIEQVGIKSKTVIIPHNLGDISGMIATGKTILEKLNK